MIATAISAALTPQVNSAETNATLIPENNAAIFERGLKKHFIVKLKVNKPLSVDQASLQNNNPILVQGKSKINFKRTLASGDVLIEASDYSSMQVLLDD